MENLKTKAAEDKNLEKFQKIANNENIEKKIEKIKLENNELKTLENKKHDYFKKLTDSNKFINNCVKELDNLEKFYNSQKSTKNYFNAKVEEDINRLKDDLTGNENEIYIKVDNEKTFIQKKQVHQEKVNSIFNTKSLTKAKIPR